MTKEIELVVDAQAEGGESPSWDKEKHVLYWVDIIFINLQQEKTVDV